MSKDEPQAMPTEWARLAKATIYLLGAELPLQFENVNHCVQIRPLSAQVMIIDYVFKFDDGTTYYIPRETVVTIITVESQLETPTPSQVTAIKH